MWTLSSLEDTMEESYNVCAQIPTVNACSSPYSDCPVWLRPNLPFYENLLDPYHSPSIDVGGSLHEMLSIFCSNLNCVQAYCLPHGELIPLHVSTSWLICTASRVYRFWSTQIRQWPPIQPFYQHSRSEKFSAMQKHLLSRDRPSMLTVFTSPEKMNVDRHNTFRIPSPV